MHNVLVMYILKWAMGDILQEYYVFIEYWVIHLSLVIEIILYNKYIYIYILNRYMCAALQFKYLVLTLNLYRKVVGHTTACIVYKGC